jgi:hypothetical protein
MKFLKLRKFDIEPLKTYEVPEREPSVSFSKTS